MQATTAVPHSSNIPYLDGWRGVAILLVLLGYFGPGRFWYTGRLGVALFFVLSGLFMGRLLFIRKVPLGTFFVRRFSRILPAMAVYVATMWFYASYIQPVPFRATLNEVLIILSFSSTYLLSVWELKWPVGQLWSLNVEEHSYVYLAVGALVIAKTCGRLSAKAFLGGSTLLVLIATALYMGEIWSVEGSPWRIRTEVASLGLIASAAACVWLARSDQRAGSAPGAAWLPMTAIIVAVLSFVPFNTHSWNFSIIAAPLLAAYAVNRADDFPLLVKRLLSLPVLRWFGTCSFSIYLWQGPFYSVTKDFGAPKAICLLLGIFAGALSYYVIENPARKHLNGLWDKWQASKLPAVAPAQV